MTDIWLDPRDAHYRVIATDAEEAGRALREKLVRIGEIGKWTPVTVEVEASTGNGRNIYREVR